MLKIKSNQQILLSSTYNKHIINDFGNNKFFNVDIIQVYFICMLNFNIQWLYVQTL